MNRNDVALVADLLDIRTLAYRYASAVDRRDRSAFLSVFRSDAALCVFCCGVDGNELISTRSGHEEIGVIPDIINGYARTFHFVGNHMCDIEGDEATGDVYYMARHLTHDARASTDHVMFNRYLDRFRRGTNSVWLIAMLYFGEYLLNAPAQINYASLVRLFADLAFPRL
jgi:ketosteroid isomerase-like protein